MKHTDIRYVEIIGELCYSHQHITTREEELIIRRLIELGSLSNTQIKENTIMSIKPETTLEESVRFFIRQLAPATKLDEAQEDYLQDLLQAKSNNFLNIDALTMAEMVIDKAPKRKHSRNFLREVAAKAAPFLEATREATHAFRAELDNQKQYRNK